MHSKRMVPSQTVKPQYGDSHTPNHLKSNYPGDKKAHERAENLHHLFREMLLK